jgi:hypothetical protein
MKTTLALTCVAWTLCAAETTRSLDALLAPANVTPTHCDIRPSQPGALQATVWKGYGETGFETAALPITDWSRWKSLKFDVDNNYRDPFSVFVRISSRLDHPRAETYTGGTFDGFVIGPGRTTVEISLENMRSPEEHAIDSQHIAWMGIDFQPLFLRDGLDLKFTEDRTFPLSHARLSAEPAKLQKQPYAGPLFETTEPTLAARRAEVELAIDALRADIQQAQGKGIDTAYAEIWPFLANIVFRSRLVAFWQDRREEQGRALESLYAGARQAAQELRNAPARPVPPLSDYGKLALRDRYFRSGGEPALLFGMLYNARGPLLRWFADSETDYGTQLVAGGTRQNVEQQPIWAAYHKYPDTHRVGWDNADHIIRDENSWEVLGPPVHVCLESPHSREAVAAMIEKFERSQAGETTHLVQNLGYEYTYVCYCDYTKRLWADWLRKKYANIAAANQVWSRKFDDFAAVPMPRREQAAENRALWFDWSSFNLYRFLEQIRWTHDQIRRWEPEKPLTVGSPFFAFDPAFWTGVDEEELADSGITSVVLEENYELDTLMPEYLHTLAGAKPVADFEYHGVIHQILPSFLHGDAAISMWWWNDHKRWTPHEPINEWTTSFPQSYTIPPADLAKAMRDALDLRRLSREITALASAPRPVALLYSKTSMLQHLPLEESFSYLPELRRVYNASQSAGLYVGVTTEKRILGGDLNQRRLLVLSGAEFIPDRVAEKILSWVERGGTLVVSPDSLLGDEYARPSGTLGRLGLRLLRREPPQLKRGETVVTPYNYADLPRRPFITRDGLTFEAAGGRQILEAVATNVNAKFQDGAPALVRLPRGNGVIYWAAAPFETESWRRFLLLVAENCGLKPELRVLHEEGGPATEAEYRVTNFEGRRLAYLYNNSDRDRRFVLKPDFAFERAIDRRAEMPLRDGLLALAAHETAIVEFR